MHTYDIMFEINKIWIKNVFEFSLIILKVDYKTAKKGRVYLWYISGNHSQSINHKRTYEAESYFSNYFKYPNIENIILK